MSDSNRARKKASVRFDGSERKPQRRKRADQFVQLHIGLIRSGRLLSPKAFRIYAVIKSFNPAYPSYKTLMGLTGYASEALRNGLEELLLKRLIRVVSGRGRRINNEYTITPESDWMLTVKTTRPSDKRRRPEREVDTATAAGIGPEAAEYLAKLKAGMPPPAQSSRKPRRSEPSPATK